MLHDGDGMCYNSTEEKRWGLNGAAGLLLRAPAEDGTPLILMQHRAHWTNDGGTWGIPGGAIDSHESAIEGARREVEEETAVVLDPERVRWTGVTSTFHFTWVIEREFHPYGPHATRDGRRYFAHNVQKKGRWTYTTICADLNTPATFHPDEESLELAWLSEEEVSELPLIEGFAAAWPGLQTLPAELYIDMDSIFAKRELRWWERPLKVADNLVTEVAQHRPWLWRRHDVKDFITESDLPHTPSEPGFWWTKNAVAVQGGKIAGAQQVKPLPFAAQGCFDTVDVKGTAADKIAEIGSYNSAKGIETVVVTEDEDLINRLPVEYLHVYSIDTLGIDF